MLFNDADMILYLYIYAFFGWVGESIIESLHTHRFVNRGVLNMPLCLSYGVIMDLLILMTGARQSSSAIQFVECFIITSAVCFLAGEISEKMVQRPLFDHRKISGFGGKLQGLGISLFAALWFFMVWKIVHPLVFAAVSLIPMRIVRITALILAILLIVDILSVMSVRFFKKAQPRKRAVERAERRDHLGMIVADKIWDRLNKAYPMIADYEGSVTDADKKAEEHGVVFAEGMCLNKVVWVFLITSLLGDIIETFYCRLVGGTWMRRSSLVFGPFSLVWGIGAALLTVVLYRFIKKSDRYIFVGGFFLGGAFEYMASVFTEAVFGMKFWDYSYMPLNFDGRTNVLFMFFWGMLALVWLKLIYPRISSVIERIPPVTGMVVTWLLMLLMCCNSLVTAAVLIRTTARHDRPEPANVVEEYIDQNYPEQTVKEMWPNLLFLEK